MILFTRRMSSVAENRSHAQIVGAASNTCGPDRLCCDIGGLQAQTGGLGAVGGKGVGSVGENGVVCGGVVLPLEADLGERTAAYA